VSGGRLVSCERAFVGGCSVPPWARMCLRGIEQSLPDPGADDSNLVDPASSHTLVSKIKPCMSK
jgi:hypothetical protein